jgi:hypothetical protein
LVGDSHSGTWDGVPGISELEGAISLRIESTPAGTARGIEVDPGRIPTDEFNRPLAPVKSDLRLQLDTPPSVALAETLDNALLNPGDFTVMNVDGKAMLLHRSSENLILRTPILRDQGLLYIERASWPSISGRRYPDILQLSAALRHMGMRAVVVPGT